MKWIQQQRASVCFQRSWEGLAVRQISAKATGFYTIGEWPTHVRLPTVQHVVNRMHGVVCPVATT